MKKNEDLSRLPEADAVSPIIAVKDLNFFYNGQQALKNITLDIYPNEITAIIGPSGCGKSTLLRCFNRMNDEITGARSEGEIYFNGTNIKKIQKEDLRGSKIGMVFQRPNPFPMSIYDNVAFGLRLLRPMKKSELDEIVRMGLEITGLGKEVEGKLGESALSLDEGQKQRLCLASVLVMQPEMILLDEPCSALDPITTYQIEELLLGLKSQSTIVIVTHTLDQAKRIGDRMVYLSKDRNGPDTGPGEVRGYGSKIDIISNHGGSEEMRDYLSGSFG